MVIVVSLVCLDILFDLIGTVCVSDGTKTAQVGHDDDVEAAMKYVFGRTIICEDMDRAKAVTFNPQVRCRTVTLQGDMFDPAGTLTGGGSSSSMKQNGEKSVLEQLTELNRLKASISIRERAYGKVSAQR